MQTAEIYRLYLLRPGARPRRYDSLTYHQVGCHRALGCSLYSHCLDFVARSPWRGFSCDRCPFFCHDPD
ncbi:MAG: hypothetical protein JXR96_11015 [Deltaproteobacteria bacterium]|nr:hypothetical protein [Deltaproteobacteria bacterium]